MSLLLFGYINKYIYLLIYSSNSIKYNLTFSVWTCIVVYYINMLRVFTLILYVTFIIQWGLICLELPYLTSIPAECTYTE